MKLCEPVKTRMIAFMLMKSTKISKGGQVSVPATVRKRWGTSRLTLEDRGDELVLRPAPDDPIAALRGAFAKPEGPSSDELRRRSRAEDAEREPQRFAGADGRGS